MRNITSVENVSNFYHGLGAFVKSGTFFESLITAIYSNEAVLPSDGWAVDGGANRGMHTFELAKQAERVIAFEPHRYLCKLLCAELLKRGVKNVTVLEQALSDELATRDFYIINAPGGFALEVYPGLEDHEKIVTQVLVTRLDNAIAPPRLDFLKLDLEGHEFAAICGAAGLLKQHRPIIAFEFGKEKTGKRYGFTANDFFDFWRSIDYKIFDICGVPFLPELWTWDIWTPWYMLAIPTERDTSPIRETIDATLETSGFVPQYRDLEE